MLPHSTAPYRRREEQTLPTGNGRRAGLAVTEHLPRIFVDAVACPVKDEVYRVARAPREEWLELVIVDGELDAADSWIIEHAAKNDIVVSADIPLASECLKKGALVLGPQGRPFTEDSIGAALATRELMSHLRDMGEMTGGPPPFQKRDRSQFLQTLDRMIQAVRRGK